MVLAVLGIIIESLTQLWYTWYSKHILWSLGIIINYSSHLQNHKNFVRSPGAQENAWQEIMEMIIPNNENQSGTPLTSDYVPYLFHCHSGWSHMKSSFHHFIAMTVGEMSVVLSMLISHWSLVFVYVRIYQLEENAAIGSNTWYTLRIPLQRLVIGCLKKVP